MLTSRERLLKCIRHQPIDRVPVAVADPIGSWHEDSWELRQESYRKLIGVIRERCDIMYALGVEYKQTPIERDEAGNKLEIREWDEVNSHYTGHTYHSKDKNLTALYRVDEGVNTTWTLKHLLEEITDIDSYLSIPYDPPEIDMARFFREKERLGDRGVMVLCLSDPICVAASLFEMSTFLVHAITERERIKYFLDAIHERQMFELRSILKHDVKDDILYLHGPEYATPPYLPPDYFYDYVTCYLIESCRAIKEAGAIPAIHCHGKVANALKHFAMTDAEVLDPLEPPPDGDIELADVKRLYGNKFCLCGNIELKEIETADRNRIDFLVKSSMDAAKEGSGYILTPCATPITAPLPQKTEENYIQMIESGLKYGAY